MQKSCENLSLFFTKHSLKLNTKKTELIIFSEKHQGRNHNSKFNIILDDNKIEVEPEVKYLGVIVDQFLTFQGEFENILRKYIKKKPLSIKNRLLLLNALVISQLHYPAILLSSLTSNLVISLEKQLSWAIKTCCDRRKFDCSSDPKLEYKVLPVSLFLDWKKICHLWKIQHKLLPAYTKIKYVNNITEENKRTKNYTFKQNSAAIISKIVFFFRKSVLIWNQNANSNINSCSLTYKTMKFKFREYFPSIFRENPSMATYGKTTWKQFKFI